MEGIFTMSKIKFTSNVELTIKIFETMLIVGTTVLTLISPWVWIYTGNDVLSYSVELSLYEYNRPIGVIIIIAGIISIVTLWTKLSKIALATSAIQILLILYEILDVANSGDYYCDISTIHVVIGAISLVGMVLLFINTKNSKN